MFTTTVGGLGRLCNGIIRNIAVSLIAEKHDLSITYQYANEMNTLGLRLFSGRKVYPIMIRLKDINYFDILQKKFLTATLNITSTESYLQTPEIVALVYKFLHRGIVVQSLIASNPYAARFRNNNDTFVHVRLTDAKQYSPGSVYYLKAIAATTFTTVYIASDDFEDTVIKEIVDVYPNAVFVSKNEIETIQFGSTCKNVILSQGSFSAVIGMIAFFSTVYYPPFRKGMKPWCGDMLSGHGWIKVDYE
jgi:hypothetical protein